MTQNAAVEMLAALAQNTRLGVYRLLAKKGPQGLAPRIIAAKLHISQPTLSFHLRRLSVAGLVSARRHGRFINYSTSSASFDALIEYLSSQPRAPSPENASSHSAK